MTILEVGHPKKKEKDVKKNLAQVLVSYLSVSLLNCFMPMKKKWLKRTNDV